MNMLFQFRQWKYRRRLDSWRGILMSDKDAVVHGWSRWHFHQHCCRFLVISKTFATMVGQSKHPRNSITKHSQNQTSKRQEKPKPNKWIRTKNQTHPNSNPPQSTPTNKSARNPSAQIQQNPNVQNRNIRTRRHDLLQLKSMMAKSAGSTR